MTKDEQIQANLIIAKALGHEVADGDSGHHPENLKTAVYIDVTDTLAQHHCQASKRGSKVWMILDIFTNPSDCQAAVIHLGEKRRINIEYFGDKMFEDAWYYSEGDEGFKTYQEAVAAAYLALEDK